MTAMREKIEHDNTPLWIQYDVQDYIPELHTVGISLLDEGQNIWIQSGLRVVAAVWKGINRNCNKLAFSYLNSHSDVIRFILGEMHSDDVQIVTASLMVCGNMTATVTAVCDNLISKGLLRHLRVVISVCSKYMCTVNLFSQLTYIISVFCKQNHEMRKSVEILHQMIWILGNLACEHDNTLRGIFKGDLWNRTISMAVQICAIARKKKVPDPLFKMVMWMNNIVVKRITTVVVEMSVTDGYALNNFARTMIDCYASDPSKTEELTAMVYFLSSLQDEDMRYVIFGDGFIIEQTLNIGQSELRKYKKSMECDSLHTSIAINCMRQSIFLAIWRMLVNVFCGINEISHHAISSVGMNYIMIMLGHYASYARANICASGGDMLDMILNNKRIMSSLCGVLTHDMHKVKINAMTVVLNAIEYGRTAQILQFFLMNSVGCIAAFIDKEKRVTKEFIIKLLNCVERIVGAMQYSGREELLLKELDNYDILDTIEGTMMEMGQIIPDRIWVKLGVIWDQIASMRSMKGCILNLICPSEEKLNGNFTFGVVDKNNTKFRF